MIPEKLREQLSVDRYYNKCCLTGNTLEKIDWHHNFQYGGKQINEWWCILPVKQSIHQYHQGITSEVKERLDFIMINRFLEKGTLDELQEKYPKINWKQKYNYLSKKNMAEDKKVNKTSKIKKCKKCGKITNMFICECGNTVWKQ